MKLKKQRKGFPPLSNLNIFVLSIIVFLLITLIGIILISYVVKPPLMELAQTEAEQAAIYAINYGLSDVTLEQMRHDVDFKKENILKNHSQFIKRTYDDDGEVQSLTFDGLAIQQFMVERTSRVQDFLRRVEDGRISISHDEDSIININDKPKGISTEIPMGSVTGIEILKNLGSTIPVHFDFLSHVQTTLERRIAETGINSTTFQLVVHVKVEVEIVLPFITEPTWVQADIPIDTESVSNKVPKNYNTDKK
nr:sporulation protein YunB [Pullulanibacillus pueri]